MSEVSIIPILPVNPNANPFVPDVAAVQTTGAGFQVNNAKHYVSVVTLSIKNNINHLANIKHGFKRTISWSKCRSEITKTPNKEKVRLSD